MATGAVAGPPARVVAVTGGAGLLGHFVVAALKSEYEVRVIDSAAPAQPHAGVCYHRADVLDLTCLCDLLTGCDAAVHLAAIDAGNPFPDETYFRTNVLGSWNVLQAAEQVGADRVVLASSSSVYGVTAQRPPDRLPIDEQHALGATDVYGLSKVVVETTAAGFARRGRLRVTCLRPAHIVRPETEAPILAQLALDDGDPATTAALAARGVSAYGPLPVLRGYVRSQDAAEAFRRALAFDGPAFAAFNVTAADSMGTRSTLDHLQAHYGASLLGATGAGRSPADRAGAFDAGAIHRALGWQARGDWLEVMAEHGL